MMTTSSVYLQDVASKSLGLYVHIPFCLKKCDYCAFLSFEQTDEALQSDYVDALIKEMSYYMKLCDGSRQDRYKVDTVFIGGGTPSILSEKLIGKLVEGLRDNFDVDSDVEISIESNPKTLTMKKLTSYREMGINRLSMGAQALDDTGLKDLGRIHSTKDVLDAFEMARSAGFTNINLDLMFGFHKHEMQEWEHTLDTTINLKPEHISFYSLQIEEDTEVYRRFVANSLKLPDEREDRALYHKAVQTFRNAGYKHYEISNCAMQGYECRHNLKYWSLEEYLGLGLGAHSYFRGKRFSNTSDLDKYLFELSKNVAYNYSDTPKFVEEGHINSDFDNISEYMITGLRRTEGVDLSEFKQKFKRDFEEVYYAQLEKLESFQTQGLIRWERGRLALTEEGIDVSNSILMEFV